MSSTEKSILPLVLGCILLLLVLSPIAWFRSTFGFDFGKAFNMTINELMFAALVIFLIFEDAFRALFAPFLLAIQYLCWIPAFNFWSDQSTLGFGEKLWFAQGWVQSLIFCFVVALSYLVLRLWNYCRY